MEESKDEYFFAMGSFKFKTFKEAYDNVKGRTTRFEKTCAVVKVNKDGEKVVLGFPIVYENNISTGKHRFVFKWTGQTYTKFNMNTDAVNQLKSQLPKFQRVGSVAKTASDISGPAQMLYGYLNIASL